MGKNAKVVLPSPLLRKLGLQAGDRLDVSVSGDRIVLAPRRSGKRRTAIVRDPITGLPVLTAGPNAPVLTSEQVREILADFP